MNGGILGGGNFMDFLIFENEINIFNRAKVDAANEMCISREITVNQSTMLNTEIVRFCCAQAIPNHKNDVIVFKLNWKKPSDVAEN